MVALTVVMVVIALIDLLTHLRRDGLSRRATERLVAQRRIRAAEEATVRAMFRAADQSVAEAVDEAFRNRGENA